MAKSVEKKTLRKGLWRPEEDHKLIAYVTRYGIWNWTEMAKAAGLQRSGKSCRLRWVNYLRPGIKHGNLTKEEEETILDLHGKLGNRWSVIASRLPGRTDNEIKNYWHSYLSKRLKQKSLPKSGPWQVSNAPEASISESSCAIQHSRQISTVSLPSSSSNPAAKIDKNQTIGSSETFGDLQSILQQPFTAEGSFTAESPGVITQSPEFLQSALSWSGSSTRVIPGMMLGSTFG